MGPGIYGAPALKLGEREFGEIAKLERRWFDYWLKGEEWHHGRSTSPHIRDGNQSVA
jgi:hypothetical protein